MAEVKRGATPSTRARLFGLRHRHRVLMLGPGTVAIGRRPNSDLVLADRQVSRDHARIIIGDQSAAIEDLGSANGVLVNGSKVRGLSRLAAGDQIQIGQQVIEVLGFADDQHAFPGMGDGEETITGTPDDFRRLSTKQPTSQRNGGFGDELTDVKDSRLQSLTARPEAGKRR